MDVPDTVRQAIADRPVEGAVCLEAGAGAGNMTAALLDAGARAVYAVTDDPDHAAAPVERFDDDRLTVVRADLRETPLPEASVDVVTAHALAGVLVPAALDAILGELTRVACEGATLIVDDYDPLPEESAARRLFAVENAAAELADGAPALTFYPAAGLRRLCLGHGWEHDRTATLLDPVPWHADLVDEHREVVERHIEELPAGLAGAMGRAADRRAEAARDTSTGRLYNLAFTLR